MKTKTIREICETMPKDSTKSDLLKELKKHRYTEKDFIDFFMSLSVM